MTSLEYRMDLTRQWFGRTQVEVGDGHGWGWVSDVPPNPQNTAEVICAMSEAGLDIPNRAGVERMVRSRIVTTARGRWVFQEPIDIAWRIRALRGLGVSADDPDIVAGVEVLRTMQTTSGGWKMTGGDGPISVTATAGAILGLLSSDEAHVLEAARRAAMLLIEQLRRHGDDAGQAFAAAHAAYVLSRPRVVHLIGPRIARAQAIACDRLLAYLSRRPYQVEEEVFSREGMVDTWRHLTLPLSLRALAAVQPDTVFNPNFREGLIAVLALQDTTPSHVSFGGFRSSPEGFVTSYATTQSLELMTLVRHDLETRVSPGAVFDLICQRQSAHHSDPQTIVRMGGQAVIMNSAAGFVVMMLSLFAGISVVLSAELLGSPVRTALSRVLLIIGSLLIGLGVSAYVSTRLHRLPNQRVALVSFTLFTSLVLPIVTFVLD